MTRTAHPAAFWIRRYRALERKASLVVLRDDLLPPGGRQAVLDAFRMVHSLLRDEYGIEIAPRA